MSDPIWRYSQSTGLLWYGTAITGAGYSGSNAGRMNPAMQDHEYFNYYIETWAN